MRGAGVLMKKLKIGQIGIGHNHAEAKMATVRKFPEVFDVVGVAEPDPAWREKRGALPGYRDLPFLPVEELLNTPGLDALLIESDVKDLTRYARLAIDRDFPIHMDKPGGEDYGEFRDLMEEARQKNLPVQLAYMYRYNPAVRYILEKQRSGELGKILHIDAHMSTEHSDEYRQWLTQFPGSSMYIFGCHLIDLIVLLQGEPERIIPFFHQSGKNGVACFDNNAAVLEYPQGPSFVRVSSTEVNGYGRRQFVVCGTKMTVEIKPFEYPTVMTVSRAGTDNIYADHRETVELPPITGRYDEEMLDFARIVAGEKENPFSYDHELRIHRATLRACGVSISG